MKSDSNLWGRSEEPPVTGSRKVNVGHQERQFSLAGGAALALLALRQTGVGRVLTLGSAAVLAYRGLSGNCPVNAKLGRTAAPVSDQPKPVELTTRVTVVAKRPQVYAYWRKLENLPRFMHHLDEVKELDKKRSRWRAPVPKGLGHLDWEAEIVEEKKDELIAWRSVEGADVDNAGRVEFADVPGDATEIRVRINYRPPAGYIGLRVGRFLNERFEDMVRDDIYRFKSMLEEGAIEIADQKPTGNT